MDKIVMTDKIDRLQLPVVKPVAKKIKIQYAVIYLMKHLSCLTK